MIKTRLSRIGCWRLWNHVDLGLSKPYIARLENPQLNVSKFAWDEMTAFAKTISTKYCYPESRNGKARAALGYQHHALICQSRAAENSKDEI